MEHFGRENGNANGFARLARCRIAHHRSCLIFWTATRYCGYVRLLTASSRRARDGSSPLPNVWSGCWMELRLAERMTTGGRLYPQISEHRSSLLEELSQSKGERGSSSGSRGSVNCRQRKRGAVDLAKLCLQAPLMKRPGETGGEAGSRGTVPCFQGEDCSVGGRSVSGGDAAVRAKWLSSGVEETPIHGFGSRESYGKRGSSENGTIIGVRSSQGPEWEVGDGKGN